MMMWSRWEWNIYLLSYDILWKFPLVIEMLMILKIWKWKSEEKEGLGDRHKKAFDLPSSDAQGVPCWKSPPIGFVTISGMCDLAGDFDVDHADFEKPYVACFLLVPHVKNHIRMRKLTNMWSDLSYFHINLTHLICLTQAFYAQTM